MGSSPSKATSESPSKGKTKAAAPPPAAITSSNIVVQDVEELGQLPVRTYGFFVKVGSSRRKIFFQTMPWSKSDYQALGETLRANGVLERLYFMNFDLDDDDLTAVMTLADPESLKVLELGFCDVLTALPDFSRLAPRLQHLGLYGCSSLIELPDAKLLAKLKVFTPPMHLAEEARVAKSPILKLEKQARELEQRNVELEAQLKARNADMEERNKKLRLELQKRTGALSSLQNEYNVLELKFGALEYMTNAQHQQQSPGAGPSGVSKPSPIQMLQSPGAGPSGVNKPSPIQMLQTARTHATLFTPRGGAAAPRLPARASAEDTANLGEDLDLNALRERALSQVHMSPGINPLRRNGNSLASPMASPLQSARIALSFTSPRGPPRTSAMR